MENADKVFPSYFPENCPPAEASSENIVLFRVCKDIVPTAEDFLTFYQMNPERYKDKIQAYGLSVFPAAEDCEKAKSKSPKLREFKGLASGLINEQRGKILRTPNKHNPAHITWWMDEGVDPLEFFEYNVKGGVMNE